MKKLLIPAALLLSLYAGAQQYPNNDFKKWDEYGCPQQ